MGFILVLKSELAAIIEVSADRRAIAEPWSGLAPARIAPSQATSKAMRAGQYPVFPLQSSAFRTAPEGFTQ